MSFACTLASLCAACCIAPPALAVATGAEGVPLPLQGRILIHGGGALTDDTLASFVQHAGGASAKLVVIPTAAESVDRAAVRKRWLRRGLRKVQVLHTRSREEADTPAFTIPLDAADAVWISGGLQSRLEDAYTGTGVALALRRLVERGGIVGGSSAGAAALSKVMIRRGNPEPEIGTGLGLLTGVIVDQHFSERDRVARLWHSLQSHPGLVGYGVDENTALVIDRREMRVTGPGKAHFLLGGSTGGEREARHIFIRRGMRADHVALRRAALVRADESPYPPPSFPECSVASGTVVLVGGGAVPRRALETFLREAGGKDARVAMINSALGTPPPKIAADIKAFRQVGATNIRLLHAADRAAAGGESFLSEIERAGGLWFTGGRQWRLVDRYLGTALEGAIQELLARGGVVGGTSAGATICGHYLVRGDPLGNKTMMAEGYERGLALLPGVAIDQHFAQRNRLPDLIALKRRYPQLLAIGLDETTSAIITGSTMRIGGLGRVTVMHRELPNSRPRAGEHFEILNRGDRFDLKDRKVSFRWPQGK